MMAGKKILVVDDSLTIQKVIRLALSNEGYEIQACSDGAEALQQISLFRPDVVLVDVSLPGKSAFQIKAEVNEDPDLEGIQFVLMSSAFEQVDEERANEVKFQARLIKPFDPAHLRQVLMDVLASARGKKKKSPSASAAGPAAPSRRHDDVQLPAAPPVPGEPTLDEDIWDSTPKPGFNPAPPPAHLDAPSLDESGSHRAARPESSSESDIRQLTEATIKMSGLDDFQWSVADSGKKRLPAEEPAIEPMPRHADTGSTNFSFDPDHPPASRIKEAYGDLPLTPPPPQNHGAASGPGEVAAVSPTDVEDAVRKHLESTLERMAQKLLPEIAEKVIKKEIHRLLTEIP